LIYKSLAVKSCKVYIFSPIRGAINYITTPSGIDVNCKVYSFFAVTINNSSIYKNSTLQFALQSTLQYFNYSNFLLFQFN